MGGGCVWSWENFGIWRKSKKASVPGGESERERSYEVRMHGTSLVVQGLRLCLLMQSMRGELLVRGLKSHMP